MEKTAMEITQSWALIAEGWTERESAQESFGLTNLTNSPKRSKIGE